MEINTREETTEIANMILDSHFNRTYFSVVDGNNLLTITYYWAIFFLKSIAEVPYHALIDLKQVKMCPPSRVFFLYYEKIISQLVH